MRVSAVSGLLCLAAALTFAPVAGVLADPLDPPAVQAAIDGWLGRILGPAVPLAPHAVAVTRAGDHDHVVLSVAPTGAVLSGDIRPAGDIWTVENLLTASPLRLNLHPPGGAADLATSGGADLATPGGADLATSGGADLATMTMSIASQAAHGLVDPTGQTESTVDDNWKGVEITVDSRTGHQTQHMDSVVTQLTVRPGPGGLADVMQRTDATGYRSERLAPDGGRTDVAAERVHLAGHIDGLDPGRIAPVLQAAMLVYASVIPGPAAGVATAVDRVALDQVLLALPGLIGALQVEQSDDGISFASQGQTATLSHFGLAMNGKAPDGLLQARFELALDGLAVPGLPLAFANLLPRHIALRPTVSGLNLAAVMAEARQAAAGGPTTDLADLFGPNGLVTSVERLSLDVGPATLTANGRVTLRHDQAARGSGTIAITGFDALMAAVGQSPALEQALPFFILAKGLSRADGESLVWDVSYQDGKAAINGTDLSAMLPARR